MTGSAEIYGVAAEFESAEALVAAVDVVRSREFGRIDALSPTPIAGLEMRLQAGGPSLSTFALAGVLAGGVGCFGMIAFATMADYPFNVAGRPFFSWPYFIIPSFASAMLVGSVVLVAAMLFLDRLPRLNHPVFNIDGIERVTQDALFLVVEARSEAFDAQAVEEALMELPSRPLRVQRVPR